MDPIARRMSLDGIVCEGADRTLAGLLRPRTLARSRLYDLSLVLAGSLVIAAATQIVIPLPIVPFTGQTFAVLMVGALLGARRGSLAALAYLLEGAAGLPVFSLGRSGLWTLAGPTGGYLVGFPLAAGLVGALAERGWDRRVWSTAMAMTLGSGVLYGLGVAWLAVLVGLDLALASGLYPFVLTEVVKIGLAATVLPLGWAALGRVLPAARSGRAPETPDFGGQDG